MRLRFFLLSIILFCTMPLFAQRNYQPAPKNLKNREWYQDAKFGMFIHWGVYSVLGDGEWAMQLQKFDKDNYEKLASFFNPVEFDAEEWVEIAKAAGMKYINITSRHHDGFAMFDSKHSTWDIADASPYEKDIIGELAKACHEKGLKLFIYYSHVDWYHDDYYPRGETGQFSGRPDSGNWNNYIDFVQNQLTELLTNYGKLGGIWFDGYWDKPDANWHLRETYDLIHELQPQCMVGNNHHLAAKPGEDFQTFEKDLPGHNTAGYSGDAEISDLPLETSQTMNTSWGFDIQDDNYKSVKEMVQYLVKAAGNNANLLLNVGPMPNGKIQPEFIKRLKKIGEWTDRYGETIYGTRGGPISPKSWGVTTHKSDKIYVHVLNPEEPGILIPDFGKKIKNITYFDDGTKADYKKDEFGLTIKIPENKIKEYDTILVISL